MTLIKAPKDLRRASENFNYACPFINPLEANSAISLSVRNAVKFAHCIQADNQWRLFLYFIICYYFQTLIRLSVQQNGELFFLSKSTREGKIFRIKAADRLSSKISDFH